MKFILTFIFINISFITSFIIKKNIKLNFKLYKNRKNKISNNEFEENMLFEENILFEKGFNLKKNYNIESSAFVLIGYDNNLNNNILKEIKDYGIQIYFSDKKDYDSHELYKIKKNYINIKNFDHKNQPWIFMNDTFIGGIFEFYSLFFSFY